MKKEELQVLIEKIAGHDCVKTDESMKLHTTFKIGGNADFFVTPDSTAKLQELVRFCNDNSLDYYVVGNGSNLLVSDDGIRGVVIQLYDKFANYEFVTHNTASAADKENVVYIKAKAGMSLVKLGSEAAKNSLTGFEFASGIPGTVGGGIMMNAGAYGGELKDVVVCATVMDKEGNIFELSNEELEFGYRTSAIAAKELIVIDATIALKPGNQQEIKARIKELAVSRSSKQPLEYPSAGSTFKRPEGFFAGKLIEEAGLKGARINDAQVSTKHAGFVVNRGNATAKDVIDLTDMVSDKIYELNGVRLELEVKKLGV